MSATQKNHHTIARRVMRLPEVIATTGYGRASIYQFMKDGTFPKCRRIGPRAVGWDSSEIESWVDDRLNGGANA